MLHFETVEPGTLSILERLMRLPELGNFCLVGGTALSLKFGHRISIDLDLFGTIAEFDKDSVLQSLENEFGSTFVYEGGSAKWAIFCFIQNIKIDIIKYSHPLIKSTELINGIKFYSNEDISAMKINAILGRGKKKDFWDLYELLHHFTLSEIIDFHREKFPNQMLLISIPQAIAYFADADESEDPISLKGQTWEEVKNFIQKQVKNYLK